MKLEDQQNTEKIPLNFSSLKTVPVIIEREVFIKKQHIMHLHVTDTYYPTIWRNKDFTYYLLPPPPPHHHHHKRIIIFHDFGK